MEHPIVLNVPEQVYQPLLRIAEELGRTPEEVAAGWVADAVSRIDDDPLIKLSGSLHTDVPNVSERHDELIGQALLAELRGQVDE